MPRGGVNCKFAKKWDCTIKPKKFLFWKYFETCVRISDNKKCDDQVRYPQPKVFPPAPPPKRCDCPNVIDWDRKTITNHLKSQLGESEIQDKVLKQLIEKNESRKFEL